VPKVVFPLDSTKKLTDQAVVGPIPQEDSGPLAGQGWGYTGVFATQNGGGSSPSSSPTRTR
jgi:hypothetical protein